MEKSHVMKSPWHLWAVGAVALLWNAAGAYSILLAQAGRLPNPKPDELAYYAAQPLWLVVVTDMALGAAIAGALGLLFRKRAAVWLYAVALRDRHRQQLRARGGDVANAGQSHRVDRNGHHRGHRDRRAGVCLDDEGPGRASVV